MMKKALEQAVDTCIDRVSSGEWTLAECLQHYPEYAGAIREYVELALNLVAMRPHDPSNAAMAFGERLVLSELDRAVARHDRGFSAAGLLGRIGSMLVRLRLVTSAIAVALAILLGGGVTLAATVSGPASPLYGYKRALERVQLQLAPAEGKADLYLQLAERRLRELEEVARDRPPSQVEQASEDYRAALAEGLDQLQSLSTRDLAAGRRQFVKSRAAYVRGLKEQRERLEVIVPAGSARSQDHLNLALSAAETGLARVPTEPPREELVEVVVTLTPSPEPTQSPTPKATPATSELQPAGATPAPEQSTPTTATPATTQTAEAQPASPPPTPEGSPTAPPATSPAPSPTVTATPAERTIVQFQGVVSAMGRSALLVGGRRVVLDLALAPDLKISGQPAVGALVAVRGFLTADGTVVAIEIAVLPADRTETPAPTPTPAETTEKSEEPAATATPASEGTPTPGATKAPPTPGTQFEIAGRISALSESELNVEGKTISLKASPQGAAKVEGTLAVGAFVRVRGVVLPGNVLAATEVKVERAPDSEGESGSSTTPSPTPAATGAPRPTPSPTPTATTEDRFEMRGPIEALGEGTMTVGGVQILLKLQGDDATEVSGELSLGLVVRVEGKRMPDGTLVAKRVQVERPPGSPTPVRSEPTRVRTP